MSVWAESIVHAEICVLEDRVVDPLRADEPLRSDDRLRADDPLRAVEAELRALNALMSDGRALTTITSCPFFAVSAPVFIKYSS